MGLADQITDDMDVFFNADDFATSATHIDTDGEETDCVVIAGTIRQDETDGTRTAHRNVVVQKSEVDSVVLDDKFKIGDDEWAAEEIIGDDGYCATVRCVRVEQNDLYLGRYRR
jgi:hypothetical protein